VSCSLRVFKDVAVSCSVCCRVLQRGAVLSPHQIPGAVLSASHSALQCVAVCYSVLQTLQCVTVCYSSASHSSLAYCKLQLESSACRWV
jgi:hypothetical protein